MDAKLDAELDESTDRLVFGWGWRGPKQMTGDELYAARRTLGELWGFGRPLHASELGRALRLGGRDPGESIRDYERGKTKISGPMSVAVELFLRGSLPPDGIPD